MRTFEIMDPDGNRQTDDGGTWEQVTGRDTPTPEDDTFRCIERCPPVASPPWYNPEAPFVPDPPSDGGAPTFPGTWDLWLDNLLGADEPTTTVTEAGVLRVWRYQRDIGHCTGSRYCNANDGYTPANPRIYTNLALVAEVPLTPGMQVSILPDVPPGNASFSQAHCGGEPIPTWRNSQWNKYHRLTLVAAGGSPTQPVYTTRLHNGVYTSVHTPYVYNGYPNHVCSSTTEALDHRITVSWVEFASE